MLSFFSHLVLNSLGILLWYPEAVVRKCSVKRVFLNILQNSEKNNCARASFSTKLQADYCRKKIATHVFSYKICEMFKNIFFKEHLRMTDSGLEVFQAIFYTYSRNIWNFPRNVFLLQSASFCCWCLAFVNHKAKQCW